MDTLFASLGAVIVILLGWLAYSHHEDQKLDDRRRILRGAMMRLKNAQ